MARKKKGEPVHGWLILDKPFDFGSTEAVAKIKWLLKAQKAGHAGTLDPLATGLLLTGLAARFREPETLILFGVALSAFAGALTSLVFNFSPSPVTTR